MAAVTVLIFDAPVRRGAGPREMLLAEARGRLGDIHRRRFLAAHAADARIITEEGPAVSFGRRLERAIDGLSAAARSGGIVVFGSGSLPLATAADYRAFVDAASDAGGPVLANNRFSGDAIAIPAAATLPRPIPVGSDNGLPRWLEEHVGRRVQDLRSRWRLQVDLDTPLDLVLAARDRNLPGELRASARRFLAGPDLAALRRALADVATVMDDPEAELAVFGRTSSASLRWLEANARCRIRAIVEERGMRSAERGRRPQRAPSSLLGGLLDLEGAGALARRLAELGDAAVVDTRVLLAHRLGADERAWPPAEDRFASDLLEPAAIRDRWLGELTTSAACGGLPILLGGHSLVGPGLRLLRTGRHDLVPGSAG